MIAQGYFFGIDGTFRNYQSETITFISAVETAGVTLSADQSDAVDILVRGLKGLDGGSNVWSKYVFIYPMVGGTAAAHAINLKSPGTYTMTWVGSPTHDGNGVDFNGTTQYGETGFAKSALDPYLNTVHMGYYTRDNVLDPNADGRQSMGAIFSGNGPSLYTNRSGMGSGLATGNGSNAALFSPSTAVRGYISGTRVSNVDIRAFLNGVQQAINTGTQAGGSGNPSNMRIGCGPFFGSVGTTNQCAYTCFASGFTPTEVANEYTAIQAFQSALGRQV